MKPTSLVLILTLFLSFLPALPVTIAQETAATSAPVEFTGTVEAINGTMITVGGVIIDVSGIDSSIVSQLAVNTAISITGTLENGIVIATTIVIINTGPVDPPSDGLLLNSFVVSYGGRVFDGSNTTFTYVVSGTGTPPDLSHFDVEIPICVPVLQVVSFNPTQAVSFGVDPTTGVNGIKWDMPLLTTETRTYSITIAGNVPQGMVQVAVKGGNGFESATLPGAGCSSSAVNVEKLVSIDGGVTWQDADSAPGSDVSLGTAVMFRFMVTNTGQTELTNLALTDNVYDVSNCTIPAALAAGAFFECTIGLFNAEAGQHTNLATVTAISGSQQVQDTDPANYFGGDRPAVGIEKSVSKDSSNWSDADNAPGLAVEADDEVFFRFVVTNTGNVPLTTIGLSDSAYVTSGCTIPGTLDPGATFDCVIGPFPAEAGQHTNSATVNAAFEGQTVSDSDNANYFGGELDDDDGADLPITIVIEGPVESININIITIFGVEIEVNPDDPLLTVIQIGDHIRVEGDTVRDGNTIIIIAITIVIVDVDVFVSDDGQVWRDRGDCSNGPPPWAPAHGWRARCGGGSGGSSGSSSFNVPPGCKITGIGNNNPRLKCSNKKSKKSS